MWTFNSAPLTDCSGRKVFDLHPVKDMSQKHFRKVEEDGPRLFLAPKCERIPSGKKAKRFALSKLFAGNIVRHRDSSNKVFPTDNPEPCLSS